MFTFNALYDTDEQRAFAQALYETGGLVEVNGRRFATTFSAATVLGRRDELLGRRSFVRSTRGA